MIGLEQVYLVAGLCFAAFALLSARDGGNPRRWLNAAFWGLLALSMLAGDRLGDFGNGLLVLALVAIAALGLGRGSGGASVEERSAEAARHGNRLFLLALVIPLTALAGTLAFKHLPALVDAKQVTLVSLSLGVLLALGVGMVWLRPRALAPLEDGRRLMDAVGWAGILPQMLASLGALFALAVTASVQLVGVYLVFTSLIVPALAVRSLRPGLRLPLAYAIGALGYLLGLALSARFDLPSGAVVVLAMAVIAPVFPWLAARWAKPSPPETAP